MSILKITAIERLGTPDPSWPSIYGPDATTGGPVSDQAAMDNGCRTMDLTPFARPIVIDNQMEKSLTKGTWTQVPLELRDADGSLLASLSPGSTDLGTLSPDRYFGPWIAIDEVWDSGSSSARRFLGVLDDQSLEWDENTARTTATVYHAGILLADRLASAVPSVLRPLPTVPGDGGTTFTASTLDDLLAEQDGTYTPRSDKLALETACWVLGQMSWVGFLWKYKYQLGGHWHYETYPAPIPPSSRISINGQAYIIYGTYQDPYTYVHDDGEGISTYAVIKLNLTPAGSAPSDLTSSPTSIGVGTTCTFDTAESELSHFTLMQDVPAPATGADGQMWMQLNTVAGITAGDTLDFLHNDTSSGKISRVDDQFTVVDTDGATNVVYLLEPIQNGMVASGVQIRRNSTDPILADAVGLIQELAAPFPVELVNLAPFQTSSPVAVWLHNDKVAPGAPQLFGVHDVLTVVAGDTPTLRVVRRGNLDTGSGATVAPGNWIGNWDTGWTWWGADDTISGGIPADLAIQVRANITQWPGASGTHKPPVMYREGDVDTAGYIPPNGWGQRCSSIRDWTHQGQPMDATWNGTAITWANTPSTAEIPQEWLAFAATTTTPGLYQVVGVDWTFKPAPWDDYLGSSVDVTPSGIPTSNLLAIGMWPQVVNAGTRFEDHEGLCALFATGTGGTGTGLPVWGDVSLVTFSCGSGGALTVIGTTLLSDDDGHLSRGIWRLGGGLVCQMFHKTINGQVVPMTTLRLVDEVGTIIVRRLPGCEVLPSTIVPLHLDDVPKRGGDPSGYAPSHKISGWYCIALETYDDGNGRMNRRARLIWLDHALNVMNGDPIADIEAPANLILIGDVLSDHAPNGPVRAQLVRTGSSTYPDQAVGFFGARTLSVDYQLPLVAERLALSSDLTLTCLDVIERLAAALLLTALPAQDGSITLCTRQGGNIRTRTQGGYTASFFADEFGSFKARPAAVAYINNCVVTYTNDITAKSETVTVNVGNGGRDLAVNMDLVAASGTMARAVGIAYTSQFGPIPQGRSMILQEVALGGAVPDLPPPFWASWSAGDLLLPDPANANPVNYWKLLQIQHDHQNRRATIEISRIPSPSVLP